MSFMTGRSGTEAWRSCSASTAGSVGGDARLPVAWTRSRTYRACPAISFALDPEGFVRTGTDQHTPRPLPLESSIPGVFAVGHVRAGSAKRVGGAIGERAAVGGAGPYRARGRPDGEALIYHVMRAAPGEYAFCPCAHSGGPLRDSRKWGHGCRRRLPVHILREAPAYRRSASLTMLSPMVRHTDGSRHGGPVPRRDLSGTRPASEPAPVSETVSAK